MQQLVALSWPMSGDVFALIKREDATPLHPYTLRLHILEADRVRTPDCTLAQGNGSKVFPLSLTTTAKLENGHTIHDGVEVDRNGKIVAYHIANNYPYQFNAEPTEFARVSAYGETTGLPNILHIMDSERPEQYRGVPYLAQAIEPLLQMRRYTEAEITAAIVQSFFTAFVKTDAGAADNPLAEARSTGATEVSRDPNEYEMGPGTMNILEPGEDVTFGSPTHPNTGFDAFMRSLCEQVGACLEIPADLLLMSFNSSYSASRAALLEAWKGFRMRREWLTDDFCRPVYEIWLTEAVARGRISAPGFLTDPIIRQAYLGSEWIGPSQGQLDPTKEVQAAVMAIDNGLSTREAEAVKLNGSQFSANADKLAVENEQLRRANGGNPAETTPKTPPNDGEDESESEPNQNHEEKEEQDAQKHKSWFVKTLQHYFGG
jgi:lambda family phage portal protein